MPGKREVVFLLDETVRPEYISFLQEFILRMCGETRVTVIADDGWLHGAQIRAPDIHVYTLQQITGRSKPSTASTIRNLNLFFKRRKYILHIITQSCSMFSLLALRYLTCRQKIYYILPDPFYSSFVAINPGAGLPYYSRYFLRGKGYVFITSSYSLYRTLQSETNLHARYLPFILPTPAPSIRSAFPHFTSRLHEEPFPVLALASPLRKPFHLDTALEILKHLSRLNDSLRFVVIGDGPEKIRLLIEANFHRLSDKMTWLPKNPDLSGFLRVADAVLYPPFSPIPVEAENALSVGTPLFVQQTEGIGNLIQDPLMGAIYKETRSEEIAAFIARSWVHTARPEDRHRRELLVRTRFTMQQFCGEWSDIYENLKE